VTSINLIHCNSLLLRLPWSPIQPLQRVMNAAARVIINLSIRYHVKPALKDLPLEQRITCKLSAHALNSRPSGTSIFDRLYLQFPQPSADTG